MVELKQRCRRALVQGRHHLSAARQGFCRQQPRRHRRLRRPDREARLPARPRRHRTVAAAVLSVAGPRRRLRHRRLRHDQSRVRQHEGLSPLHAGGAPPRHAGHHRAGDQPYVRPASLVPASASQCSAIPTPRNWYVWSDNDQRYAGTRIIFNDTEKSNWTWDPVANAYYWHRFFAHQPDLNFDNPRVIERADQGDAPVARRSASTASAWTQFRICASGKGPATRTCLRPTRSSARSAQRSTPIRPTSCCSPRPISGRRTSATTSATATNATWRITSR